MEKEKTISVIVPVYNSEKMLSSCIESILTQSYPEFELILVDDGSTDKSSEICKKHAVADARIRYVRQKNAGASAARNKGIELATGEFITFVDSDDTVESDFLRTAISKIEGHDYYLSGVKMLTYNENGSKIQEDIFAIKQPMVVDEKYLLAKADVTFPQICFCGPWAKLFKRQIIVEHNIRFDLGLINGEDTYFNLDYIRHINSGYFDTCVFYNYQRTNPDSLFSKYKPDIYEIYIKVYDKWRNRLSGITEDKNEMDNINNLYSELMIDCIAHVFIHEKGVNVRKQIIEKVIGNQTLREISYKKNNKKIKLLLLLIRLRLRIIIHTVFHVRYR